jgi:hypothetical protein
MLSNEESDAPEFVEGGDHEIDADVIKAPALDFPDEFLFRGIVENHRRRMDVFCDIVKPPAADHLAVAEDALAASHLGMKEFGTHGIPFARPPKGMANGCEQQIRHLKRPPAEGKNFLWHNHYQKEKQSSRRWTPQGIGQLLIDDQ